ncbi:MAG: hypothetical protein CMO55_14155 [Verrucomicrobiales bacterium]|nr:hypothetical protein [Verrucomicrobiales bacterium]
MNRTTSSRRKRWFFARSMSRAYQEWLENKRRKQNAARQRPLFAEALEPRVLFSGTPAPVDPDMAEEADAQQQAAQEAEMLSNEIDGIGNVLITEEADADFTEEDVERLAQEALSRWEETGLTEEQINALESINYVVTDLGGSSVAAVEGDTIFIDDDAAGFDWFIDDTEWADEEFTEYEGYLEALTEEAMEGIDLLTAIMHEQGHILGLEDVDDVSEIDGLMGEEIGEGVRRLPVDGSAEGLPSLALEETHYLVAAVAADDTGATDEDTVLNVPGDGVLSNDSGDPALTVTAHDALSAFGAEVVVNADGSYSYDPTQTARLQMLAAGETIVDTFSYTVTDGDGSVDTATVSITVTGVGAIEIHGDDKLPDGSTLTGNNVSLSMNGGDMEIHVNGVLFHTTTQTVLGSNPDVDINLPSDTATISGVAGGVNSITASAGSIEVSGNIVTVAGQTYQTAVTLVGDTTLDAADVVFVGTVDSDSSARSLSVNATGMLSINSDIGVGAALASFDTTGSGEVQVASGFDQVQGELLWNYDFSSAGIGASEVFDSVGSIANTGGGFSLVASGVNSPSISAATGSNTPTGISAAGQFTGGSTSDDGDGGYRVDSGGVDSAPQDIVGSKDFGSASFEFWINPDLVGTSGSPLANHQMIWETGGGTGTGFAIMNDGTLRMRQTTGGIELDYDLNADTLGILNNTVPGTYSTGQWMQITGTLDFDTDTMSLYVNGVKVAENVGGATSTDWDGGDPSALGAIGGANAGGWGSGTAPGTFGQFESFDGQIAVFRLYEGVLTGGAAIGDGGGQVGANFDFMNSSNVAPATVTVVTSGNQNHGDTILGTDFILTSTTGDVTLSGTFDDDGVASTSSNVTLNSSGVTTISGVVGGTDALLSLTTDAGGSVAVESGSVTTLGAQTFGENLTTNQNTTFSGGTLTFEGTSDFSGDTTISSGFATFSGATVFAGMADIDSLGDTIFSDTVEFGSTATVDARNVAFSGVVTMNGDITVTTSNDATFSAAVNGSATDDLTVNSSGSTTFTGGSLGSVTTDPNGRTQLDADMTLTGAMASVFNDRVLVRENVVLTTTGSGDLVFNSSIDSESGEANDLTLTLTQGDAYLNGDVGEDSLGGNSNDAGLGNFTVNGNGELFIGTRLNQAAGTDSILNFDASVDGAGSELNGISAYDLSIGSNITVNSNPDTMFSGITSSWVFPTAGSSAAADRITTLSIDNSNIPGNASAESGSIEVWFKPASLSGPGQVIWESGGTGDGSSITLAGSVLTFQVKDGPGVEQSGQVNFDLSTLSAEEQDDFVQVVAVYVRDARGTAPNDRIDLYVNGEIRDTLFVSVNDWIGTDGMGIGGSSGGTASSVGGNDDDGLDDVGDADNAPVVPGGTAFSDGVSFEGEIAAMRYYRTNLNAGNVTDSYILMLDPIAITTVGDQTYDVATQSDSANFNGANVTFGSTLDSTVGGNSASLAFSTSGGGETSFGDVVGGLNAVRNLTTNPDGYTTVSADITSDGDILFGDSVLINAGNVTITQNSASGAVVFGSTLDGADGVSANLTVNTPNGATTQFGGNVGSDALGSLSADGGLQSIATDAAGTTLFEPVDDLIDGFDFFVDAGQDTDSDLEWEDLVVGNPSGLNFTLDDSPAVTRVTGTSGLPGITGAYDFPGGSTGNEAGANISSFQAATGDWTEQDVTFEMWFKPDNLTPTPTNGQILFEDGGGTGIGLFLDNNELRLRKAPGGGNVSYDLSTDTLGLLTAPATDEFIQAVFTYDIASGVLELFVNGVSVGTDVAGGGDWSGGDAAGIGTLGGSNAGGIGGGQQSTESFDGQVAMVRVYRDEILTPLGVQRNYYAVAGVDSSKVTVVTAGDQTFNDAVTSSGDLTLSGGNVILGSTVSMGSNDLTISVSGANGSAAGEISGTGGLTKQGAGTFELAATNTFTENTTVVDGTLLLTGSIANGVTVESGGTLAGAGTVNGNGLIQSGGTLSPGNGTGDEATITFTGDLDLSGGATIDLSGSTVSTHDLVSVGGTLTVSGDLNLVDNSADYSGLSVGDEIELFSVGTSLAGEFSGMPEGALLSLGGAEFQISYAGGDGNDIVLVSLGIADTDVNLDGSGNLVITDANGGDTDDTILITVGTNATLSQDGYTIFDSSGLLTTSIAGSVRVSENEIFIPFTSISGSEVQVDTLGGTDTLIIDLQGGGAGALQQMIVFTGGTSAGDNDTLEVRNGVFGTVTHDMINGTDGSIDLDSNMSAEITYTGLEPVDMTGSTATDFVFNLPAGVDNAQLTDIGGGILRLESTDATATFESTDFASPSGSITINGGSDDFLSLPGALTLSSDLILNVGTTTIAGDIALGGNDLTVNVATGGEATGIISGTGNVNKGGDGTFVLSGNNSYDGITTVTDGILQLNNANALGASGSTLNGTVVQSGGALDLNFVNLPSERVTINGTGAGDPDTGALFNSAGSMGNNGVRYLILGSDATIGNDGGRFGLNSGTISGAGFTLTKVGSNEVWVNSNSTYANLIVNDGVYGVQGDNAINNLTGTVTVNAGATLGTWTQRNLSGDFIFNDGTLSSSVGTGANVTVTIGGTIALTGTNTFNVPSWPDRTLATFITADISGTGSIDKVGGGELTMSGTNSYTGVTDVLAGTLYQNGAHTGAGSYTVASGAILAGTGSTDGVLTVDAGGTLAPGVAGVGTLTFSNGGTVNGTLEIELDGTGTGSADVFAVVGNLDISAATLSLTALSATDDPTYAIASYTGALTGTFVGIPDGSPINVTFGGTTYVFTIDYTGGAGTDIVLTSAGQAETSVEIDGSGNLVITDINGGTSDDNITIVDDGAGNYVISDPALALTTSIPGAVRIDANTIQVSKTDVTGGLIVNTLGETTADVVTISGSNALTFTGDVTINAETINLNQDFTANDGADQDIVFNGGVVVGGSVTLTGANLDFNGDTDLNGNTLILDVSGDATSSATSTFEFNQGTLTLSDSSNFVNDGTAIFIGLTGGDAINGTGTFTNNGTFRQDAVNGSDDNLFLSGSATFLNQVGGTIFVSSGGDIELRGSSHLNNLGLIQKMGSTSNDPTYIFSRGGDFTNSGTIQVENGHLNLAGGFATGGFVSTGGDFITTGTARLTFSGRWAEITGASTMGGGDIELSNDNPAGTTGGGFSAGAATTVINVTGDGLFWQDSDVDARGNTIRNDGTIHINGSGADQVGTGTFENGPTGVLELDTNGVLSLDGGTFVNNGTVNQNDDFTIDGALSFVNGTTGTFEFGATAGTHTLTLSNPGFTNNGTANLNDSIILAGSGTFTNAATGVFELSPVNGNRTITMNNTGGIVNDGTFQFTDDGNISLSGSGTFTNNANFVHSYGGANDNFIVTGSSTFNNNGTLEFQNRGDLQISSSGVFNNSGLILKTSALGDPSFIFGPATFNNLAGGEVRSNAGQIHVGLTGTQTSDPGSTWTADGGDIGLGGTWTGTFSGSSANGGFVEITNSTNGAILSDFEAGAAGATFNIGGDGLNWVREDIISNGNPLINTGTFNIVTADAKSLSGVLTNQGTLNIDGDFSIDGGELVNASGGTVNHFSGITNLLAASDIIRNQSGGAFHFTGALSSDLEGNGRVVNEAGGLMDLDDSGGLDINTTGVGIENDGTFNWVSGASLDMQMATSEFQNDGTFNVTGSANRALNGVGTFTNNGTFNHSASGGADNLQGLSSGGSFVNNGLFDITVIGDFEMRDGYTFTNTATGTVRKSGTSLSSDAAQFFSFSAQPGAGTFSNEGTVEVLNGILRITTSSSDAQFDDNILTQVSGTTLTGGTWIADASSAAIGFATLDLEPADPNGITTIGQDATVRIIGAGAQLQQLNNNLDQIDGSLTVNGTGNLNLASGVTMVGSTGLLAGSGTVTGDVLIASGGTLSPGDVVSGGVGDEQNLTIDGDLTISGDVNIDISGMMVATNDLVTVTGSVDLTGGTLNLIDTNADFSTLPLATEIVLIAVGSGGTVTGTFSGIADGDAVSVGGIDMELFYARGDGNDVVLYRESPAVANDDDYTGVPADEDTVYTVDAGTGVLINDSTDIGFNLTVGDSDTESQYGASVTVNPDGSFSYDPTSSPFLQGLADGESVVDTFTYQTVDGRSVELFEFDGMIVGEANDFSNRTDNGGDIWELIDEDDTLNNNEGGNPLTGARFGNFLQVTPEAGGGFSQPNESAGGFNPDGEPKVQYTIVVSDAGTYQLFVRASGSNGGGDSFYVSIEELRDGDDDNGGGGVPDWYRVTTNSNQFSWTGVGTPETTQLGGANIPLDFDLAPGTYTLSFYPREDGVAIDSFALVNQGNATAVSNQPSQGSTDPEYDSVVSQTHARVSILVEGVNDDPETVDRERTIYEDEPYTFTTTASLTRVDGVYLSEFHYDNTGDDADEYVELAGMAGFDLTGWSLVFYDGNGGDEYGTIDLTGTNIDDEGQGLGAVAVTLPAGTVPDGFLENGPDAIALIDSNGQVVEFISYEGTVTAQEGPAAGYTSANVGATQNGSPVGSSIALTDRNTWQFQAAGTPGTLNPGQENPDFYFGDLDRSDLFYSITIETLPTSGMLQLSGMNVTAGQEILLADIPNLVFVPALNVNGSPASSFTFTVNDENGGSSPVRTFSFNVLPVNDAPVANPDTVTAVEDGGVNNGTAGVDPQGNVITGNILVSGDAGDVSNADTDPDGDTLAVVRVEFTGTPFAGAVNTGGAVTTAGTTLIDGAYGTLEIAADGSYTYTVNQTVAESLDDGDLPTDVFTYTIIDRTDLIAYYNFEAPDTTADDEASDNSGNGNDGTFSGIVAGDYSYDSTSSAVGAQSLLLNEDGPANAGRLSVDTDGYDFNNGDWTFSGWFNRADNDTDDFILHLGAGDGFGGGDELHLYGVNGSNDLRVFSVLDSTPYSTINISGGATPGSWNHVALSYDAATQTLSLYLNGELGGSLSGIALNLDNTATIGGHDNPSFQAVRWFNGNLDDTALFSSVLEPEYIRHLATGEGLSSSTTLTINVAGANDAPTIGNGPDTADLDETDAGLTASGDFSVSDPEVADVVTASVASVSATGNVNGIDNATLLAMLSVGTNPVIGGSSTSGTINWAFDSGSEAFNFLNTGETLELEYSVRATDDGGAFTEETVTITITGTNDGPVAVDDGTFQDVWQLGVDNGNNSDFTNEGANTDEHYYFAGTYTTRLDGSSDLNPVRDEPFSSFDRALTNGDPNNFIHFNLRPDQLDNEFQIVIDNISNNVTNGPITFEVVFNGNVVFTDTVTTAGGGIFTSPVFTGASVGATTGDNVIEIRRTTLNGGWMQFDRINLQESAVISVGEDDVLSVSAGEGVLVNDTDPDIDGVAPDDSITVTAHDAHSAAGGVVIVNADGSYTYDSNGRFNYLALGESATDTFTYTISDSQGATDTATVTVTILGSNDAPNAVDDGTFEEVWRLGVDNNNTGEFEQEGGTNAAPGNPNLRDDDYYFTGEYGGTIGTVPEDEAINDGIGGSSRVYGFERALIFSGADSTNRIHFNLDPGQLNDEFQFSIDFIGIGGPNVGGVDVEILFNGVVIHTESLAGGGLVTTDVFDGASVGAITGDNVLTIRRTDTNGGWITIDTLALEARQELITTEDDVVNVSATEGVLSNDSDPDFSDTVSVSAFDATSAGGATVVVNADGSFTYDPTGVFDYLAQGETYIDTFQYTITDLQGETDTATVTLTVRGINDAPELANVSITDENEGSQTSLTGRIDDADFAGDGYTLTIDWGDPNAPGVEAIDLSTLTASQGTYNATTGEFEIFHVYVDDDPTATAQDSYSVSVQVWETLGYKLQAHYNFDSGDATDSTDNNNDGAVTGGTVSFTEDTASALGGGQSASTAQSGYISVASSSSLEDVNDQMTVSFWLKAEATDNPDWVRIIRKGDEANNGTATWMVNRDSNTDSVGMRTDTFGTGGAFNQNRHRNVDENGVATLDDDLLDGNWHLVTYVIDGTSTKEFIDGQLNSTKTVPIGDGLSNTADLRILGRGSGSQAINGSMDDVAIWNRPLTDAEVAQLALAPVPVNVKSAVVNVTTTVTNVDPDLAVNVATEIDEDDTLVVTGSYTDPGLYDTQTLVIDWDDPNAAADSTFAISSVFSVNPMGGSPIANLAVNDTISSSTDGAVLTITAINTTTGEVSFSVSHQYLDDGVIGGNATASDDSTITFTITDDDTGGDVETAVVTVNNVIPSVSLNAVTGISENGTAVLTGSITDAGKEDAHTFVVDWGDANDLSNATFAIPATSSLTVSDTFNSSTDDSVLTITGINLTTGEITFSVTHQYLDDGVSATPFNGANGTASDTATITAAVYDDDMTGVAGYSGTIFTEGSDLNGYWQFEDGTGSSVAIDSSGNGYHATANGDITFGNGSAYNPLGESVEFDGNGDYFSTGATAGELGFGGDFTASAWIYLDDLTGDKTVFGTDSSGANNGLHLVIRNGRAHFGFFSNDTGGTQVLNTGQWYHVTWRYTSATGEQALFVDGSLDRATTGHAAFAGTANEVVIGRWSGGGTRYFDGLMDEVSVIGRSLSDIEIAALAAQGPIPPSVASTTVEISNVGPVTSLDPVTTIDENGTAVLNGTIADPGLLDSHHVTVDWDDDNDTADATFDFDAIFSIDPNTGALTQELMVGAMFNSTSDDSVLEITGVNTTTGEITFTVSHQYLDDGASSPDYSDSANGTASDAPVIKVSVVDDDQPTYSSVVGSDDDLTGYWRFEENTGATTVHDSSGNDREGELIGDAALGGSSAYTSLGGVLTLDGNGDYYSTGATAGDLGFGGDFTASAWVNFDSATGDMTVFGTMTSGANNGLHLVIRDGRAHFGFFGNDTPGTQTLNTGEWYHITWRYTSATQEQAIFVNGALDRALTGKTPFTGLSNEVVIGRWNTSGRFFDGMMDEVSIIGRSLSADEIAAMAATGPEMAGMATTTVTINNVDPTVSLDPVSGVDENGTATVTGTITDIGRLDSHRLVLDWDDANDTADATFDLTAIYEADSANGSLTQLLGTAGYTTFNSSTDDSVLTITGVNATTGEITFSVTHQYLDDGPANGNATASDVLTISATVTDDDGESGNTTANVTVSNVAPVLSLDPVSGIDESGTAVLTGTITDIGRLDGHNVVIDWGDSNDTADATFDLAAIFSANVANGALTQLLGAAGYTSFNSTTDDSVLTITAVNTTTGVISFQVTHRYHDDGTAVGNGTANDISTISVTVTDDDGQSDMQTETVTVTNVAPVIVLNPVSDIDENESAVVTGSLTDPGLLDQHNLVIDWDDPNDVDDATFAIPAIFSINPADGTTTPVLFVGQMISSSTDESVLRIDSINTTTGEITFTVLHQYLDDGPDAGINGSPTYVAEDGTASNTSTITSTVDDDDTGSGGDNVDVTVNNTAPVPGTNSGTTDEDHSVVIDLLAGATDQGTLDDIFLDSIDTTGTIGQVTINPDNRTITYDPLNRFQRLSKNETATDTFRFTLIDDDGTITVQEVTVTIVGKNDKPITQIDRVTVTEGGIGGSDVQAGNVLDNDSDIDQNGGAIDDVLQVVRIKAEGKSFDGATNRGGAVRGNQPTLVDGQYGTLQIDRNGNFVYAINNELPNVRALKAGETVQERFTYTVSDGNGGMIRETILVTVRGSEGAVINNIHVAGGSGILEGFRLAERGGIFDDDDGEDQNPILALFPTYSGTAQPGTVLTLRIYGIDGMTLGGGSLTVVADISGNWSAAFSGMIMDGSPYFIEIEQQPPTWDIGARGVFRTYYAPAMSGSAFETEALTVDSIFGRRLSTVDLKQTINENRNPNGSNEDWRIANGLPES